MFHATIAVCLAGQVVRNYDDARRARLGLPLAKPEPAPAPAPPSAPCCHPTTNPETAYRDDAGSSAFRPFGGTDSGVGLALGILIGECIG